MDSCVHIRVEKETQTTQTPIGQNGYYNPLSNIDRWTIHYWVT